MPVQIKRERPDSPDAVRLIKELEDVLDPLYNPDQRFGYSIEKLLQNDVRFFVIRVDGAAAGCGGIQLFDDYGELKRMYVRPSFRGLGLAKKLIAVLANEARQNNIKLLRLETGIHQIEAIGLYETAGFYKTGPFGDYTENGTSIFYEKKIN